MLCERFWTLSSRPTFISALAMFCRSTRPQSGSRARTSPRSSRTASKSPAFSGKCIGKRPHEETRPPKPDSPDRNSKTKRYPQALGRTRSVSTALKATRLKSAIYSINGSDRKVGRSKGSTPKVSSKPSKPTRPSKSGTARLTRS